MNRLNFISIRPAAGVAALVLCAVGGLAGCQSESAQRDEMIRANITPELDTLHERPADVNNAMALTTNENLRMAWQDLGRVFLFDRPSSLRPEPTTRP